jgi:hypothetical protein
VNAAVVDSVLTGAARRIQRGPVAAVDAFKRAYEQLLEDKEYRAAIETGTSQEANVETRLRLATEAFATVP